MMITDTALSQRLADQMQEEGGVKEILSTATASHDTCGSQQDMLRPSPRGPTLTLTHIQ